MRRWGPIPARAVEAFVRSSLTPLQQFIVLLAASRPISQRDLCRLGMGQQLVMSLLHHLFRLGWLRLEDGMYAAQVE